MKNNLMTIDPEALKAFIKQATKEAVRELLEEMKTEPPEQLTVKQAAKILNVSVATLYLRIEQGIIKPIPKVSPRKFHKKDILYLKKIGV